MCYEAKSIADGCWAIQDGNVRMYLLDGGTDAVLIDTGYGSGNLKQFVSKLVKGNVHVINTHSHNDHTSGNHQFEHFYVGAKDLQSIVPYCPCGAPIEAVQDGDTIAVGTVKLKVIAVPGHTPGAIALLDPQRRLLFSGDTFAKFCPIYMQFPGQNLSNYLASMRRLLAMEKQFDRLCSSHGELEIEKDYMHKTINCCCGIMTQTVKAGLAALAGGGSDRAYWYEDVAIFY